MQAKSNQNRYVCPSCEKKMGHEVINQMGQEVHHVYCTNEDCDYEGVNWDLKKLESYECNQIARVEELLNVED